MGDRGHGGLEPSLPCPILLFLQENVLMDYLGDNEIIKFCFSKVRLEELTVNMSIVLQETRNTFLCRDGDRLVHPVLPTC